MRRERLALPCQGLHSRSGNVCLPARTRRVSEDDRPRRPAWQGECGGRGGEEPDPGRKGLPGRAYAKSRQTRADRRRIPIGIARRAPDRGGERRGGSHGGSMRAGQTGGQRGPGKTPGTGRVSEMAEFRGYPDTCEVPKRAVRASLAGANSQRSGRRKRRIQARKAVVNTIGG